MVGKRKAETQHVSDVSDEYSPSLAAGTEEAQAVQQSQDATMVLDPEAEPGSCASDTATATSLQDILKQMVSRDEARQPVHHFLADVVFAGKKDMETFSQSVQVLAPCASGQETCYAGFQSTSRTPRQGTIHVLFLNIFANESYPFATLVSDCLEVANSMLATGVCGHVLEVEAVKSTEFPANAWRLRFGAGGAHFNCCLLGAYGLVLVTCLKALSENNQTCLGDGNAVLELLKVIHVVCPQRGQVPDAKSRALRAMTQTSILHKRHRRLDLVMTASLMKKMFVAATKNPTDSLETDQVGKDIAALIKKYNSTIIQNAGQQLRGRAAFAVRYAISDVHLPDEVFTLVLAASSDARFNDGVLEQRGFYVGLSARDVSHKEWEQIYRGSVASQRCILQQMMMEEKSEKCD
ncbi:unnamed protein product, partial [Symbiodinium sp. KB8]